MELSPGWYIVAVSASDSAGNMSTAEIGVTIVGSDTSEPRRALAAVRKDEPRVERRRFRIPP
jgi:hypothetical protein